MLFSQMPPLQVGSNKDLVQAVASDVESPKNLSQKSEVPSERNLNQNIASSIGYSSFNAASVQKNAQLSQRPTSESAKFIKQMMIESRVNSLPIQMSNQQMRYQLDISNKDQNLNNKNVNSSVLLNRDNVRDLSLIHPDAPNKGVSSKDRISQSHVSFQASQFDQNNRGDSARKNRKHTATCECREVVVISSGGLALYPIETALKSIYNLKQGKRVTSASEFLAFVQDVRKCCVSSLRLVIFDGEMPDAQKIVS